MNDLERIIYLYKYKLREKENKAVFWKEKNSWHCKVFTLENLLDTDRVLLKAIREIDDRAVVLDCEEYIGKNLISLQSCISSDLYVYRQQKNSNYNIGTFLKNAIEEQEYKSMTESNFLGQYAEKQEVQTLKFDKEKFLKSKMGSLLCEYVEKLYMTEEEESNFIFLRYKELIEMILIALEQCYGVKYYILFTKHEYGVFSPDTNDWLYRR